MFSFFNMVFFSNRVTLKNYTIRLLWSYLSCWIINVSSGFTKISEISSLDHVKLLCRLNGLHDYSSRRFDYSVMRRSQAILPKKQVCCLYTASLSLCPRSHYYLWALLIHRVGKNTVPSSLHLSTREYIFSEDPSLKRLT